MYTPLKASPDIPMVNYGPVNCGKCQAFLNPYCQVDLNSKMWGCPFCFHRNKLPTYYLDITPSELPAELHPKATTIEYALPSGAGGLSPVFLFVVDICIREDELVAVKESLLQILAILPPTCYVGLITYGSSVQLYEIGFSAFPKVHLFEPQEMTTETIRDQLGVGALSSTGKLVSSTKNNFVLPLSKVDLVLTNLIENLTRDPVPSRPGHRSQRATGVALKVALSLLQFTFKKKGARVLFHTAGPCTVGPGKIVDSNTKEGIRSHHHLKNESARWVHTASKYYGELAQQAVDSGHAVDIFSGSLDQAGVLEMWDLPKRTGGVMTSCESFTQDQYTRSLVKLFEKDAKGFLKMGFNVLLEVKASKKLYIQGAIGHLATTRNRTGKLSEDPVGVGKTCEWKAGVVDPTSSFAIYFEVRNDAGNHLAENGQTGMVQFKTYYTHPSGQRMLRVTTLAHAWAPRRCTPHEMLSGFDQEATIALVARLAIWKSIAEDMDVLRWLDRHLIQFTRRYAQYRKGDASSLVFPPNIALYPTFMFHLRRGVLVSLFGSSPDETTYYRHYSLRETISNSLTMIQPTLDSYSFASPEPVPEMLSSNALQDEKLVVLDTFFHVVVWHGKTINEWKQAEYHLKPEYANLASLLAAPRHDAEQLLNSRFPFPLYVQTGFGGSQARFLLAAVDPANSAAAPGYEDAKTVNTEDASLESFVSHLRKFTVEEEG
eukprot:TRINITY_DN2711_c0_g1_i1.p1 TRINITY_DN2711_c0_g1~~TRINITY_DN2711_c0_g1_i1.p1  ORF type:complete len:750 (-),score=124.59 TRINITY_DN2711_c0_g1_i1:204-2351(-)